MLVYACLLYTKRVLIGNVILRIFQNRQYNNIIIWENRILKISSNLRNAYNVLILYHVMKCYYNSISCFAIFHKIVFSKYFFKIIKNIKTSDNVTNWLKQINLIN